MKIIKNSPSDHSAIKLELRIEKLTKTAQPHGNWTTCSWNSYWENNKIKAKITKLFEANENKETMHQDLWDKTKAVFKGKFISLNAHIRKLERFEIDTQTSQLKELEKQEQ